MNVGVFLGVFALIFLLELPDKSMIATIVMSTRARSSSIVIGASAGFVVQMGIAVGAGGLLTLLPLHVKDIIVAVLFLGGAGYLLLSHDETAEEKGTRDAEREQEASRWREIITAFSVIFLAEFGDLTQIQAANLTIKTHQPLAVIQQHFRLTPFNFDHHRQGVLKIFDHRFHVHTLILRMICCNTEWTHRE